jgi:HAE1 family hydrophobic/amphiphilic exporter-1
MVFSTLLGIFFVPVFFLIVRRLFTRTPAAHQAPQPEATP